MKRKSLILGAAIAAIGVTAMLSPVTAAVSDKVRKACEAQANEVRPALRAGEKEAFIANCLANATATKGRK